MHRLALGVSPLLFLSGLCALVLQTAWQRDLRLVFGASTAASAAVLAIFMGGLGAGGIVLGRRADRASRPLELYGNLELAVALSAAMTPALMGLARIVYVTLGGSAVLGPAAATVVRIGLAVLVMGAPAFLMGGTLPAAARAVSTEADVSRRDVATLYGVNTLGAVTGAALATFFLLEVFGNRTTLWMACLTLALVGMSARVMSRRLPAAPAPATVPVPTAPARTGAGTATPPPAFTLVAAALVGFSFLLMELVWFRILGPLLGGSTYTFGLILAVALAGIGLGGAAYAAFGASRPATLRAFAVTCALEALFVAVPYALGDRLAVVALLTRTLRGLGFGGLVLSWGAVASVVVLPAAFVAGVQFPLLVALLGRGREDVGRHVGLCYGANTAGSIVGSLAGGFGLLPLLSAAGAWSLVVVLLAALAAWAAVLAARAGEGRGSMALAPAVAAAAVALVALPLGPTAAWRHSPIGAGRADEELVKPTTKEVTRWLHEQRRSILWERDGVESSVAMSYAHGVAFVINGKVDGHARGDAATQVMTGMMGALLHEGPRRALVIGLGTGSTAGWLGKVPGMERVDVVELEPAIAEIARACGPVNQDVLTNPQVRVKHGDAREFLLATPERYDIIFSEPSNPYRAGIASLFTREYYAAAAARLAPGGRFIQWMQAYEVDGRTVQSLYATLATAFPYVETWQSHMADLMIIATLAPVEFDATAMRARAATEPWRSALFGAWRAVDIEGIFARYVGGPALARMLAARNPDLVNTDDQNLIEFAVARTVGRDFAFAIESLRTIARRSGIDRPEVRGGDVDWDHVEDERAVMAAADGLSPPMPERAPPSRRARVTALREYVEGNLQATLVAWRAQADEPRGPVETAILAEALADAGDATAEAYTGKLRGWQPIEADVVLARLRFRQERHEEAADLLARAFVAYRTDPWPMRKLMGRALALAEDVVDARRDVAQRLWDALAQPFSVYMHDERRRQARLYMLNGIDFRAHCVEGFAALEPWVPWEASFLRARRQCYRSAGDPRATRAAADLETLLEWEPLPFEDEVRGTIAAPPAAPTTGQP